MARIFATTKQEISEREKRNMNRARKMAADGMVLLQNDGVLPISEKGNIALFGNGARGTVKGGTGSGDVNSRMVVNVEQGLAEAGFNITTKVWLDRYDRAIEQARKLYFEDVLKKVEGEKRGAFWYMFNNPFQNPPIVPIEEKDIEESNSDIAVYVIGRSSGEGKDRKPIPGEYELLEEEKNALKTLTENYDKVVVVLNVGGVIDTKYLRELKGINAILLMSQAGNIGGYALADVLTGKEVPSGRLTSTWANNYSDYPSAMEFSHMNGNLDDEFYNEGIYVGYRYFDSFGINPAYPFGYGLSYTDFKVDIIDVNVDKNIITLYVKVKNIGELYSGREVVQAYYSAPLGDVEKPYQELAAFAKTQLLAPGQEEVLKLIFSAEQFASYDKTTSSWIIEKGKYYLRVGKHSRNTKIVAAIEFEEDIVVCKVENMFDEGHKLNLFSAKEAVPYTYDIEELEKDNATILKMLSEDIECSCIEYRYEKKDTSNGGNSLSTNDEANNLNLTNDKVADKESRDRDDNLIRVDKLQEQDDSLTTEDELRVQDNHVITIDDIRNGKFTVDDLVNQLTVSELAELCVGTARFGLAAKSVIGVASLTPGAAGDTARHLRESRNLQSAVMADGPAGLRLTRVFVTDGNGDLIPGAGETPMPGMEILFGDIKPPEIGEGATTYYQYCTALPVATLLAQTWDVNAYEAAGDIVGEEMSEFGIHLWLAPGMNIHRNPLCGRNFEYYSEDPFLTGICATHTTIGVQKHPGRGVTIKHYAFNNQEDNRMRTNAYIDERAIREIYLKGFEMAVKNAKPMAIMTSYNLINQEHTASSKELCTYIARDEWGFGGVIVSDWNTTGSMDPNRESPDFKYPYADPVACIKAGNDIIMPGSQWDVDSIINGVFATENENKNDIRNPATDELVNSNKDTFVTDRVNNAITLEELKNCAKRVIELVMKTQA